MDNTKQNKKRPALFLLRAAVAFALLCGLLAVLYHFGYHGRRDVAEWIEPGHHEALIYDGETYELVGRIGSKGLALKKYPIDKILGEVRDDGLPKVTEEITEEPTEEPEEPEETEADSAEPDSDTETETEPVTVIPPFGAEFFDDEHEPAYILYSVEDKEEYLLVLEPDGEYYLYQRVTEDTAEDTSA